MQHKNRRISIYRDDIKHLIYFIMSIAQEKKYGGLNKKSDYVGGVFDRWINIISESLIFDKYFLPLISGEKVYFAVSDFYRYEPLSTGIAPDLIGIKIDDNCIPFSVFGNDGWERYNNAPQIEVKTFKKEQYLVSLRNQNYGGKYLVLLEMDLKPTYLLPFFGIDLFDESVYKKLKMDDDIFISNETTLKIEQVERIVNDDFIGTLSLIKVTMANDFMSFSNNCGPSISPHYIADICKTRTPRVVTEKYKLSEFVINKESHYMFNDKWYSTFPATNILTLSWTISQLNGILILKISGSSITLYITKVGVKINGMDLLINNAYIIKFKILDRSGSKGEEYFIHKSIINILVDHEESMLKEIKEHINNEVG